MIEFAWWVLKIVGLFIVFVGALAIMERKKKNAVCQRNRCRQKNIIFYRG